MAHCSRCNSDKPDNEFSLAAGAANGRSAWCKQCHREWVSEHNRTVNLPAIDRIVAAGPKRFKLCPICRNEKPIREFPLRNGWRCYKCALAYNRALHAARRTKRSRLTTVEARANDAAARLTD